MMIQEATLADVDRLATLHATGFEKAWDAATLREFIERDLVFVIGMPIAGFIIVRKALDEAEIITLVIDPATRKMGFGALLLDQTMTKLLANDVARVFLEVASDNLSALHLYQRAGFKQVGLRKAYYARPPAPACDALVMTKQLT